MSWFNAQSIGALSAGAAVALGAFGAHGLKSFYAKHQFTPEEITYYNDIWTKASTYQMYHSIGMIIAPMLLQQMGVGKQVWPHAAKFFAAGITFFSGSLYTMVLTQKRWLGAVTPVGGVMFLLGWACMGWDAMKSGGEDEVKVKHD